VRRAHPLSDERANLVGVVAAVPALRRRATSVVPLHDPLDRLMRRPAGLDGTPLTLAAHMQVGGQYIHPFPRVLQ
jgi:hypothetical protein